MALKATIYKATVNVADMDRQIFLEESLTLARHPSETEMRLMLRLLCWISHASDRLSFTRGLCADDEPELWQLNDHNGIDLWIELGLPDERRIKKACSRATQVILYTYQSRPAQVWWQQHQERLQHYDNLSVFFIDDAQLAQLTSFAARNMVLQATLQEGMIWLSDAQQHCELQFTCWFSGKDAM
ncbi:MAG: putative protein YaeQ [Candidatus Erwinia impunctatus]|nr:putative protein YaeQ [Culicoides impunctatus]